MHPEEQNLFKSHILINFIFHSALGIPFYFSEIVTDELFAFSNAFVSVEDLMVSDDRSRNS